MDAAIGLFMEKGFANTKMIDIANAVNMGKSTLYGYFESKELLFCQLIEEKVLEGYATGVVTSIDPSAPVRNQLIQMAEFDLAAIQGAGYFFNAAEEISKISGISQNEEFMRRVHDILSLRFNTLSDIIKRGVANGELKEAGAVAMPIMLNGIFNFFLPAKGGVMPGIPEMERLLCASIASIQVADVIDLVLEGIARKVE